LSAREKALVEDLAVDASGGVVVLGWRAAEDGLFLRIRGQPDEARLRCRCGRCHWIVREQFSEPGPRLLVSCHNCGVRSTFLMEGVSLPAP